MIAATCRNGVSGVQLITPVVIASSTLVLVSGLAVKVSI
jgi:hypothetical protein